MAKRPRNRVQPATKQPYLQPSTLAKRPRNRVQPSTKQPWPKGHAIAFNLQPNNQTTKQPSRQIGNVIAPTLTFQFQCGQQAPK
ncbi:hypothetical protein [Moorena bouillonii]|uniref:Uncharacterized protein n=1 Tax=Moorena bouillonii PNG TaxID=568701 RepID=A0A1U7N2S8_9CYAN|nr:hypothetical protein [Moorena bouillonii]OLT60259.1 hypothetical protein BJP37_15725 [Moorena bouillonii PNG]